MPRRLSLRRRPDGVFSGFSVALVAKFAHQEGKLFRATVGRDVGTLEIDLGNAPPDLAN